MPHPVASMTNPSCKVWHLCAGQIIAAFLVLLFSLGCSSPDVEEVLNMHRPKGQGSGVHGRALVRSDVQTEPDTPLQAVVLAISLARVDALLGAVAADPAIREQPARLGITLTEDLFGQYVAGQVRAAFDGAFYLPLAPGAYWLCLANIGRDAQTDLLPAHLHGCARIDVPAGAPVERNIYWGEAGVTF